MRLSPPSILIASLAFLLLSAFLLVSAATNKQASASISATPDGKDSTVTWGTDIDVGGFQSTSPDAVPFAYTRHKNPVLSIDPTDPNHVTAAYAYVSTQYRPCLPVCKQHRWWSDMGARRLLRRTRDVV